MSPPRRLPNTFRVLREVATAADTAYGDGVEASPLTVVDLGMFVRGVNALKATRLLLAESHWEIGAATARQLFELVVNAEYLHTREDVEDAVGRYVRFAVLQRVLGARREQDYRIATGRDVDKALVAALDAALEETFDEFKINVRGRTRWAASWCGMSTRQLAEASPDPLRVPQYENLFRAWSEQVHAAPAVFARELMGDIVGRTVERMLSDDEQHVSEVGAMVVLLLLDLWRTLPTVPPLDDRKASTWVRDLVAEASQFFPADPSEMSE